MRTSVVYDGDAALGCAVALGDGAAERLTDVFVERRGIDACCGLGGYDAAIYELVVEPAAVMAVVCQCYGVCAGRVDIGIRAVGLQYLDMVDGVRAGM